MGYRIPNACCSGQTGCEATCAPAGLEQAAPCPQRCHRRRFCQIRGTSPTAWLVELLPPPQPPRAGQPLPSSQPRRRPRQPYPLDGQRGDGQHGRAADAQHQPGVGQQEVEDAAQPAVLLPLAPLAGELGHGRPAEGERSRGGGGSSGEGTQSPQDGGGGGNGGFCPLRRSPPPPGQRLPPPAGGLGAAKEQGSPRRRKEGSPLLTRPCRNRLRGEQAARRGEVPGGRYHGRCPREGPGRRPPPCRGEAAGPPPGRSGAAPPAPQPRTHPRVPARPAAPGAVPANGGAARRGPAHLRSEAEPGCTLPPPSNVTTGAWPGGGGGVARRGERLPGPPALPPPAPPWRPPGSCPSSAA